MALGNETLLGSTGAAGVFLIDMNKVFEQFVTVRLSRYLSGRVTVCPQHRTTLRPRGGLLTDPGLRDRARSTGRHADLLPA